VSRLLVLLREGVPALLICGQIFCYAYIKNSQHSCTFLLEIIVMSHLLAPGQEIRFLLKLKKFMVKLDIFLFCQLL